MLTKLLDLNPQRRDAILNAALKEFSSKGYDNASTNVIAKEAGISKALMFHYVSSKQELFLVVYAYFSDLIKNEYVELMNYDEKDIFDRLVHAVQMDPIHSRSCSFVNLHVYIVMSHEKGIFCRLNCFKVVFIRSVRKNRKRRIICPLRHLSCYNVYNHRNAKIITYQKNTRYPTKKL